jgi:hypothetical protein
MKGNIHLKSKINTFICIGLLFLGSQINAAISDNYAGIEVGSKGVKLCILNPKIKSTDLSKKIIYDTTINTDFIKFTKQSAELTSIAIYSLYYLANERFNIPKDQIFLAISSGVKQTADREKKPEMITLLQNDVKELLQDKSRSMELITLAQESVFTHKSIVPQSDKMTTIVIDIGSGNTKGGYYISDEVFNTFTIGWASKSIYNYVEKKSNTNSDNLIFFLELQKKLAEISNVDLPAAIDKCGITNFDFNIVFSGGIVWGGATLMNPDQFKDKRIEVTYDELHTFYNQIYKNYAKYTSQNKSEAFVKEKQRIEKVFNQRSLMAGTGLLLKIMRKFEPITNTKKFTMVKDNKSGWLPAYIQEKVKQKLVSKN